MVRPWWISFLFAPGCLLVADDPTSVKLLEAPPVVTFAFPVDDELVNGVVQVDVSVFSELEITSAELEIDRDVVDDWSDGALGFEWDTFDSDREPVDVVARATDEVGRVTEEKIRVEVDQLPDLSFLTPIAGDTLAGDFVVEVTAEDDGGDLENVALLVDGEIYANDVADPYRFTLPTCEFDSGGHLLEAQGEDSGGQGVVVGIDVTFEQPLGVEIDRTSAFTIPADEVVAEIAWDQGVQEVRFELDGDLLVSFDGPEGPTCSTGCDGRCRVFTWDWDTSGLAEGEYELAVVLVDDSGRTETDTFQVEVEYDVDGDGFTATGYGGTDCDDTDASIKPGGIESCNGADDDCAGGIDEDFDGDGDGYAGAAACAAAYRVDCDDADDAVHPGATEVCGDAIDNDCDGPDMACRLTGDQIVSSFAQALMTGESSSDVVGETVSAAGDVDGDGVGDLLMGSFLADMDSGATNATGGMYLVSGIPSGTSSLADAKARIFGTVADGAFGYSAAPMGDIDGDGFDDFVVGESSNSYGRALVFRGPLTGSLTTSSAWATVSLSGYGGVGWDVASGDVDGDGDTDLLVGRGTYNTTYNATLWRGPIRAGNDTTPDTRIDAENSEDLTGYAVDIVGDFDGDGRDDLIVTAPGYDYSTSILNSGGVYLFEDPSNGTIDSADADAFFRGTTADGEAGFTAASGGDQDGDGYADVLIGGPLQSAEAGKAWMFQGPRTGTLNVTGADAILTGSSASYAGIDVAAADLDADGLSDVAVGAPGYGASDAGVVWVMYGPYSGSISLDSAADLALKGSGTDQVGWGVAGVPDLDGDGADELLLGCPTRTSLEAGGAYLVMGVPAF